MNTRFVFTKPVLLAKRALAGLAAGLLLVAQPAATEAVDLYPLFDNPETQAATGFGNINMFADASPFFVDNTATLGSNNFSVFTMDGVSGNNGAGFSVAVSNGENGIDQTLDGSENQDMNDDVPNTEPVNAAISSVNGGGGAKLQNGNVIRLSAWMRQDPNSAVTAVPQIEPVMKIELWKEASSGNADFNPGPFPTFGDRVWDTDQNAGDSIHASQSQADWVDMNNSGSTSFGKPVSQSLVTDEWRLVETEIVIDDDPLDDGFGWGIGDDAYTVAEIEEIRGVVFFGDFAGTDLTGAGSIWIDNVLMEIFADEASVTANMNPVPIDEMEGIPGDFDGDGDVDIVDFGTFGQNFGMTGLPLDPATDGDFEPDGDVDIVDFGTFGLNFGTGVAASGSAVPEPASALLVLAGLAGLVSLGRQKR